MKVGYLQFKPEFGKPVENISSIRNLISDKQFDLLVLPELANSGYLFSNKNEMYELSEEIDNGNFCNELKKICSEKNSFIISGICERDDKIFYNSSVLISPDGNIKVYRKLHLFDDEKKWFTRGNLDLEVYEISGKGYEKVKIGMMICFDWIFPETARTLALKGAQIICHPSNLVMHYCQNAMFTRALENHVFTITANRIGKDVRPDSEISFTGESVIIDPKGQYLYRGSKVDEEVIIIDIDPSEALNKKINFNNDLFGDRRKTFYKN
ncbi:MAG: nitrilase-related carbon-nitrogen hydrolase [Ignavibacteria bacterium]